MSRPPFPTSRRPQTPNGNYYDDGPASPNTTRPLQIGRPGSRPTTPSSRAVPLPGPSSATPPMPVRPARSGLRGRNTSELSGSERLSLDTLNGDYRDSTGTTRSDASQPPPRPPRAGVSTSPPNAQIQTSNLLSPLTPSSAGTELSPSEAAALAMFQHSMAKRRGMTEEDVADVEYRREKEREAAIQMDRQRRIRAKVPGMRAHKPRAGDIDGECCRIYLLRRNAHRISTLAVLNEIKDEWEIATNPDVSMHLPYPQHTHIKLVVVQPCGLSPSTHR